MTEDQISVQDFQFNILDIGSSEPIGFVKPPPKRQKPKSAFTSTLPKKAISNCDVKEKIEVIDWQHIAKDLQGSEIEFRGLNNEFENEIKSAKIKIANVNYEN